MTNTEEFIFKHLDRNFQIGVGENGFAYIDNVTGHKMSYSEFTMHLNTILGVEYIIEYNIWINKKRKELLKNIFSYLDTCDVRLGRREWGLVDPKGNPISITELMVEINLTDEDYCKGFEKIYEEWFLDKIIEHTEKTMLDT